MSITQWIIKKLAPVWGLEETIKKLNAGLNLGEPTNVKMPKEVVSGGLEFAATGLLNMFAIQCNLDWVMPYWVNRQYDPTSGSYVPGTVLSTNLTHRNWTAIGTPASEREPVVDPTGLLTPWFDGWSVEFWVGKNKYLIIPSKNTEVYQYLVKQLPIVVSQFIKKDVRLRIESFVASGKDDIICNTIGIENLESIPVELSAFVSIRPYNPEGIAPIQRIAWDDARRLFTVDGKTGLVLTEPPDRVYCSRWEDGDAAFKAFTEDQRPSVECEKGLATALAEFKLSLEPGQVREITVRALSVPRTPESIPLPQITVRSHQELRQQTVDEWEKIAARGTSLRLPYQKMQNAFHANKAHLYLFIDDDVITPGPYMYHHEYFRDAAYSLLA
ncbi:MAG TPA: hypothetical protein ENN69_00405, partial [Spirochaetia bacterium]|nr:hypothetical protein [Spirochaetia bacterium]